MAVMRSVRMLIELLLDTMEQGYASVSLGRMVEVFLNVEIPDSKKQQLESFVERRILS